MEVARSHNYDGPKSYSILCPPYNPLGPLAHNIPNIDLANEYVLFKNENDRRQVFEMVALCHKEVPEAHVALQRVHAERPTTETFCEYDFRFELVSNIVINSDRKVPLTVDSSLPTTSSRVDTICPCKRSGVSTTK